MSHQHKTPVCTNCAYKFSRANNYCPICGQKNHELRIPLTHLLGEVLETTLHFDSKTIRTIKLLLLKPGFLSLEFNSGKRADYVPPIRLYVLISFMFFFLLSLLTGGHKNEAQQTTHDEAPKGMSITYSGISSFELAGLSDKQVDSLMAARNMEQTAINKFWISQIHKFANRSMAGFSHVFIKNISYMMFLLMPVLGAWIYIFNKNSTMVYRQKNIHLNTTNYSFFWFKSCNKYDFHFYTLFL